uniref:Uncharacterized protein n=1 Tax=Emiliania huxleyi TaxID=2903 RepID=A0A6V2RAD9_EMIHU
MAPSVSAAVLTVLFWWCEETDHTADGVCNILWSSQQLGMTSDGTQLRGLEQMMAAHAPRTEAEYARDIGSIFNSYCTAAEGSRCSWRAQACRWAWPSPHPRRPSDAT